MGSQRKLATCLVTLCAFVLGAAQALSADRYSGRDIDSVTRDIEGLKLASPITTQGVNPRLNRALDPSLIGASGQQKVIVRLRTSAVASMQDALPGEMLGRKFAIDGEQAGFAARSEAAVPSFRVIARTQLVLNAVFAEVDAADLSTLALDPAVVSITPVGDYELHLSETVPYIGASTVQGSGFDGSGIRVAVLDSGIDYTHANLGGSGNPADYAANDPGIIEPGTFPTARVVGGFDFVGSTWPATAEAFDPDPLDDGPAAGHGTHVADIIAGSGGVAPGADLYAVKVCSSVATSCSGLALILGMEFAVDPDGDGDPSDAVDVINMSLGSSYGQPFDDDLSLAVNNATALGVLTVASAGNSSDKPYVTGSPAASDTALSVAQTQVPSAGLQLIDVDGSDYAGVFQPWSVPAAGVTATQVQYADGAGGNLNGCNAFAGSLTSLIVLVDRGACNFTLKIKNIGDAGGAIGIIGLVAPGAPFSGGDGGDAPITIPGFMISQVDSSAIKAAIAGGGGSGVVDSANQLPLVMQMVGSSSRGPRSADSRIKPEIGAPGASVSAVAGTGTGAGPFGGTSGASPMVAGSAALLLDKYSGDDLDPAIIKALLITSAETAISTDPFTGLAPISRIGGGEVRVDRAANAQAAAVANDNGTLSFGFVDVARDKDKVKLIGEIEVHSMTGGDVEYSVTPVFRYANDEATGAVKVKARSKIIVQRRTVLKVEIEIDGSLLAGSSMNSGSQGANGSALTLDEYDGYLILDDGVQALNIPWHVLPRRAAEVKPDADTFPPGGFPATVGLDNKGVGTAQIDAYSLIAVSPDLPEGAEGGQSPTPDIRAFGINTIPVPPGFCSGQESFLWLFAFNTWERQTHLAPVAHQVSLDIDQDGTFDFAVFNFDLTFNSLNDGRQLTWAQNLTTGGASAFFFAEHATNTGNTVMIICGEQVGLTGTDILATNVDIDVSTFDIYFGGPGDTAGQFTVTPLGEQYFALPAGDIPGNALGSVDVYDFGPFPGNSPELGVLLMTNGDRGAGARGGATRKTEATIIAVEGADVSDAKYKGKGKGK